jgi:steroid 5-alpha reductase family enzyme
MIQYLLIAMGLNLIFFLIAYYKQTDKLTDITYAATFIVLAVMAFGSNAMVTEKILALLMILLWAFRLGGFLFIRINTMQKDKRFDTMRSNFWSFSKFWMLQGLSVFLLSIPVLFYFDSPNVQLSFLSVIGFIIWIIGFFIETIADFQKYTFKNSKSNKDKWISTGLFKHIRHPNYLGELLIWYGVYLYTFSSLTLTFQLIGLISPIFITILLVFISGIPLLDKSSFEKWGKKESYLNYRKNTGALVPKSTVDLVLAILIAQLAGVIGGFFTLSSVNSWYTLIEKPVWNPPNWIFGPVWTTLYLFMGIASFLIWTKRKSIKIDNSLLLYGVHLMVNVLWSFVFFYLHEIKLALVVLVILWILIAVLIVQFYRIYKSTIWLMLPYLLWVTFAGFLNYSLIVLNP